MKRFAVVFSVLAIALQTASTFAAGDQTEGQRAAAPLVGQQPRLSQAEANQQVIRWLKRSEREFSRVTKIPNDFPDEHWWPEMIRAYVDAGDGDGALEFSTRWHMKFGQSCGREMTRLAVTRLSDRSRFEQATQIALLLVETE